MQNLFKLTVLFIFPSFLYSQPIERPKLVVGIVVDQMRFDYIYRYWDKYEDNGIKRLVNQGFNCNNTHYSYVPTYTAPGHATIFTGTTPSGHGIVSNDWYSREKGDMIYCTEDKNVNTVRSIRDEKSRRIPRSMIPEVFREKSGQMSPANMLSSTFGDELRLFTNQKSKVVGVALKDRGAILPAGHLGDAYWFDAESGDWISSSFYMNALPKWLQEFNNLGLTEQYLNQTWNTLLPIKTYTESLADDNPYEFIIKGKTKPVFPYDLKTLTKDNGMGLIRFTPFGNSLTKDIALAAIKGENLGKNEATDMITISFSSTDYIGHSFGTDAIETQDTYLRLDKDLAELFSFLDNWVGMENCLVFLTADHGSARVPAQLSDLKMPAGYLNFNVIGDSLKSKLKEIYNAENLILSINNDQVYFDHKELKTNNIQLSEIIAFTSEFLMQFKGVQSVYSAKLIKEEAYKNDMRAKIQKGFMEKRSGDLFIVLEPAWMDYGRTGTTHGSNHSYDTHVPLIFMGWKVEKGETSKINYIEDIAPTISQWLRISFPNAMSGQPIEIPIKR
jgi:predicted AlkP superfamily pyrophosphatase or phosphodiesterase